MKKQNLESPKSYMLFPMIGKTFHYVLTDTGIIIIGMLSLSTVVHEKLIYDNNHCVIEKNRIYPIVNITDLHPNDVGVITIKGKPYLITKRIYFWKNINSIIQCYMETRDILQNIHIRILDKYKQEIQTALFYKQYPKLKR